MNACNEKTDYTQNKVIRKAKWGVLKMKTWLEIIEEWNEYKKKKGENDVVRR